MLRIERYIFRTATMAFLAGLAALTGVVWVTQALRQIDLLTNKGQTLLVFLTITGLTLPSLVAIIAPVALFAGVLYSLNKLNGDSELVVMSASGVSPGTLLRPFLVLFALVFALVAALYLEVMPRSFDAIETLTALIHADFITNFARPGAFNELEPGLHLPLSRARPRRLAARRVHAGSPRSRPDHHLHFRGRQNRHARRRDLSRAVEGHLSAARALRRFGDRHLRRLRDRPVAVHRTRGTTSSARASARPPSCLGSDGQGRRRRPTWQGRMRGELVDRLASPLYAFAAGLIGFAALGEARTTRQGRGVATGVAVLLFAHR